MALVIALTSGHTFDETNGDTITPELLNKMMENGFALVTNLPVGLSDGGSNATTAQGAAKNFEVVSRLAAWLEFNTAGSPAEIALGTIPADSYILDRRILVDTAFNAGTTNDIRCGTSGDTDEIFVLEDVSATGEKTPTAGTTLFTPSALTIIAQYVETGGAATTGKALVVVTFAQVPTRP